MPLFVYNLKGMLDPQKIVHISKHIIIDHT